MQSPASQLAAMRKQVKHTCPVCGETFQAIRTRVYCGETCKTRAKRKRARRV